jgi:hypothetical protein
MFKDLVFKEILDNYTWAMINPGNRRNIVNFLNNKFFSDNIAEFIDITTDLDIDMLSIGLEVKYKNISYKLSEFDNYYKRIERFRKLNRINEH